MPSNFTKGNLLVSDDGKRVVWMLAPGFYGRPVETLSAPGLAFYVDGKRIKTWSWGELIVRPQLVSLSTSHTHWIMERRLPNWAPGEVGMQLAPDGSRLTVETSSFRSYVFDTTAGAMTSSKDSEVWREADLIFYGEINGEKGAEKPCTSKDFYVVKGEWGSGKREILFRDPTNTYGGGQWATVALKRDGEGWRTIRAHWQLPMIYNALTKTKMADESQ